MSTVEIRELRKSYGAVEVVHGLDLTIDDGEFVVLVGPSGCGKSTILRMICGLEEITAGTVSIGGTVVNHLPPKKRNVAMVFQDYALYPHMSVAENMGFGLRMRRMPRSERDKAVRRAAEILQISHLLDRKPRALSGGQRQRVAMGRAIVRSPSVFLYDEPLSNLDAKLRIDMRAEIKKLQDAVGTTSIFVTHDQVEAMTLADRIVCLTDGRVAQIGTPNELYNSPADLFVASFIGAPTINLLQGRVEQGEGSRTLRLEDGGTLALPESLPDASGQEVTAGFRPEDVEILPGAAAERGLSGEVLFIEHMGADTYVHASLRGREVVARCGPGVQFGRHEPVRIVVDSGRMHLFDGETGRRLQG